MVDLKGLHARMRPALDAAMARVMGSSTFIKGSEVAQFEARLETVMNLGGAAIGCGNGTDALTLALMALGVGPGDEVIVPDFSFISTAETVALRGATPGSWTSTRGRFNWICPRPSGRSPHEPRPWCRCTCLANAPTCNL